MSFISVGQVLKCKACGRQILVENIINGTNHTVEIIVNCWDCCPEEMKKKAFELYPNVVMGT